jgi:hypothetical protein
VWPVPFVSIGAGYIVACIASGPRNAKAMLIIEFVDTNMQLSAPIVFEPRY